ncbi:MAG: hypothetical protein KIS69_10240 [Bacteroidetes bacterium]|nr:hypothetical protein [Bacteroidota bacterium]
MATHKYRDLESEEIIDLLIEKLQDLKYSINNNMPKSAIVIVLNNLIRTAIEKKDYTWRGF